MTEFLETRSMNLNVRVSPQTKMQLTQKAQQLGLNMTDYIYVVIAKSEAIETDLETLNADNNKLEQQIRQLQVSLNSAKKEADSNVTMLNASKIKLEQQVRQLQASLANLKKEVGDDIETLDEEKRKLQQQAQQLQANLAEYENLVEPFAKEMIGQEVTNQHKQRVVIKNKFEIAQLVFSNFKLKTK